MWVLRYQGSVHSTVCNGLGWVTGINCGVQRVSIVVQGYRQLVGKSNGNQRGRGLGGSERPVTVIAGLTWGVSSAGPSVSPLSGKQPGTQRGHWAQSALRSQSGGKCKVKKRSVKGGVRVSGVRPPTTRLNQRFKLVRSWASNCRGGLPAPCGRTGHPGLHQGGGNHRFEAVVPQ